MHYKSYTALTPYYTVIHDSKIGGGRVERRCWVNFHCRGVLLVWMIVGQGPIALAIGAGGGCLDIFSLIYLFSFLSPSLWEAVRYRLKYCLKGPLSPKQLNQPNRFQNHARQAMGKKDMFYLPLQNLAISANQRLGH